MICCKQITRKGNGNKVPFIHLISMLDSFESKLTGVQEAKQKFGVIEFKIDIFRKWKETGEQRRERNIHAQ